MTGVTVKTTGKTSSPAKNTRDNKKGIIFEFLSLIQERDESHSDLEVEGVTDSMDPPTMAESDKEINHA